MQEKVKFDFSLIPEYRRQNLLAIIHAAASEYMKQPGVAEEFEKWKAERKHKADS